jgi:hypothetical protein
LKALIKQELQENSGGFMTIKSRKNTLYHTIVFLAAVMVMLTGCTPAYSIKSELQAYKPGVRETGILEKELRGSFDFFWNTANTDKNSPGYGLIPDRMPSGPDISSIASVGYGLTAICIGVERGYITREEGAERVLGTLKTLNENVQKDHGFFYHFLNINTGQRAWNSEVSIIDTALCLNGVIFSGEYFGGEIAKLAARIYEAVDWPWYTDENTGRFYMGYTPEKGFEGWWDMTAEQMMMYFLGAGSPTNPIKADMFYRFHRPRGNYGALPTMMYSPAGSLFAYQYTHLWYDFRNSTDKKGQDWFRNSIIASLASRLYAMETEGRFKTNGLEWGFSASDGPEGYKGGYGSPPSKGFHNDGTIPPYGPAGSTIFTPEQSITALVYMYDTYPDLWGKWGFKDAYNKAVSPMWIDKDVIGIDKGATMLAIENYLTGMVWKYMMKNKYIVSGMQRCGVLQANSYMLNTFEDGDITGVKLEGCKIERNNNDSWSGIYSMKVNSAKNGTIRFAIDNERLKKQDSVFLSFAVKGKGRIITSIKGYDGTVLSTNGHDLGDGREWKTINISLSKEKVEFDKVSEVLITSEEEGIYYIDHMEFTESTPRVYNVILDGKRQIGGVLKPVWNTWDIEGRQVYIDSVKWYRKDTYVAEWIEIEGADRLTYTITDKDANKYIKCDLRGVVLRQRNKALFLAPAQSDMTLVSK